MISTRDLDRGSLWFGEINDQLKDTTVGIICLTHENKNQPWILFEAGALAKGLSTARVCTLLIDLEPKDIGDPLAQFNHTIPTKESVYGLVRTLNGALGQGGLDPRILEQVFMTYWPQFEIKFKEVLTHTEKSIGPVKPRPKDEMIEEILENTRTLTSRMRRLEHEIELFPQTPDSDESPTQVNMGIVVRRLREMMIRGLTFGEIASKLESRYGLPRSVIHDLINKTMHDQKKNQP